MAVQVPIVNEGERYMNGLHLEFLTTTTFQVTAGLCRDSTNVDDIILNAPVVVDINKVGVGGLDEGTPLMKQRYTVYLLGDSTKFKESSVILSLSDTGPVVDSGYDMVRIVGHIATMEFIFPALIEKFYQTGDGVNRTIHFSEEPEITPSGTAIEFTKLSAAHLVPVGKRVKIQLQCAQSITAGPTATSFYRPGDATGVEIGARMVTDSGSFLLDHFDICTDTLGQIEYKVNLAGNPTQIVLLNYVDSL
jgi:hypothetical protein